jgi:Carboxypeptidase regulatory-like domain
MNRYLLSLAFVLIAVGVVFAQGVTTSSISGLIKDQGGEPLPGATILALHTPSGTQYGTSSRADGSFTIPNTRVGGPYTITTTFVGYNEDKRENVFLSLGQTHNLRIQLSETAVELEDVEIVASREDVFNSERTGASTNISRYQLPPTRESQLQERITDTIPSLLTVLLTTMFSVCRRLGQMADKRTASAL